MKKPLLFCTLFLVAMLTFGQSGTNRSLSPFDKVSAQEGVEVILRSGSSESAVIEADGIDVEDVLTEVEGSTLRIHLEGDNHRNVDVKVIVTYKQLSALGASSAASIVAENELSVGGDFDIDASSAGSIEVALTADDVDIDVSSSGNVQVKLTAASLDAELSSAGRINASGKANTVSIGASSSGTFSGDDFSSEEADLQTSSGASIKLEVKERLDARASSGGSIRYKGNPSNTNSDSSSGGSVRKY